jgi:hypothetical protein
MLPSLISVSHNLRNMKNISPSMTNEKKDIPSLMINFPFFERRCSFRSIFLFTFEVTRKCDVLLIYSNSNDSWDKSWKWAKKDQRSNIIYTGMYIFFYFKSYLYAFFLWIPPEKCMSLVFHRYVKIQYFHWFKQNIIIRRVWR